MTKNIIIIMMFIISVTVNIHGMLTMQERAFMGDTSSLNSQHFVVYIEKTPSLYGESNIYGIPYSEMIYQMRVAIFSRPKTNSAYIMLKNRLHVFPFGFRKSSPEDLREAIKSTIDDCYTYLLQHIANRSASIPKQLYGYKKAKSNLERSWTKVPRPEALEVETGWEKVQRQKK